MQTLIPCPSCGRHVRVQSTSCPFCATTFGTTTAATCAAIGLAFGLALSGCGDDGQTSQPTGDGSTTVIDQGGEDYGGPGDTGEFSTDGGPAGTSTSENPAETDQGGEDYGGPGDTSVPQETGTTSTTGEATGSGSGGTGDTGTTGG
jgi:hypothetical protein